MTPGRDGAARAAWIALGLLALSAAAGCFRARTPRPDPVPAAAGVLDLRAHRFESDGPVALAGEWELCWGELLGPEDPPPEPGTCGTMSVPGLWTDGDAAPGKGVATYRLRVLLPARHPPLALHAGAPLTAHRLWIDGRRRPGTGTVARVAAESASKVHNRTHYLPDAGDELHLLVQVANFDFRSGGLRRRWVLGSQEDVATWSSSVTLRDAGLATVQLLMGLLFLGFWATRTQDRERLYFTFACLALGLRVLPSSYSDLSRIIAPGMMFPTNLRLEYFANNFMAFAGMGYFAHKVPKDVPWRLARGIQLGALAGMLGSVLLPLSWMQLPLRSAWILGGAMLAISLFALARAARRGEPNVRITLAAVPLCLAVVLWDSLRAEGAAGTLPSLFPGSLPLMVATETMALFPTSMLLLMLTEAMVLMRTFSRSYATIESLSKDLLASNEDLRQTNRAVARFVPFDFLRLLGKDSIRDVERGDSIETEMSILFCDIRSFTTLVESMSPDGAFRFVNDFTEWMEPEIHEHGGFINAYIGDCIVALFPTSSDHAVHAAIAMIAVLDEFNEARRHRADGDKTIRVGIGINTGPLMLGTIGGHERLTHNVIGDSVNVASRVESLTKFYGAPLLISGSTRAGLTQASYELRELDRVVVKGRNEPIPIFEVLDALDEERRSLKIAARARFDEARAAYARTDFGAAEKIFVECLARTPGDLACELYIERCRRLAVEGVPPTWRGETLMTAK